MSTVGTPRTTITVHYQSIDHFSKSRHFKTLKGAQKFAQRYVGPTPEVSTYFNYAVSPDGIGKVTASIPVAQLFPALEEG